MTMSTDLQKLLRDSLLNNTYDYDVMHNTLKNTWTNSYTYLYDLQRSYIEYEEHTYISNDTETRDVTNIGHLYLNKSLQACFDIGCDFVYSDQKDRFRRSKFYYSEFTFNDMISNPKLFKTIPIILIDNQAIWDYKLYQQNGTFTVILPFNSTFVIENGRVNDKIVYKDHKIQVFIVKNTAYKRITLTKDKLIDTNTKSILIDTSKLTSSINTEGIYFLSVHTPNNNGKNYELGTTLMPCSIENDKFICKLSDADFNNINNPRYSASHKFYVSFIFINELHQHTFYTGNPYTICENNECNLFVLQRDECIPYAMPIPKENLIILKKRGDTTTYIHNTDSVTLYYPNIYRIIDSDRQTGDIYYVYYFYRYTQELKYTPLHDFYYDFLKIRFKDELLEKIIDNLFKEKPINDAHTTYSTEFINIFKRILNYSYKDKYKYGEIDFSKRYLLEDGNEGKSSLEYKDETFREWVAEDPKILRDYVLEQNKLHNAVYHLYTKSINLAERVRNNTRNELNDEGFDLTENCYVFAFHNKDIIAGKLLDIRVFVDGLFVSELVQYRYKFIDYLYIPTRLIGSDSYIEVEIFPTYEHSESLRFTSLTDTKTITLLEPNDKIYPTVQDIYYIDANNDIMNRLVSKTQITDSIEHDTVIVAKEDVALILDDDDEKTEVYDTELFQLTTTYGENKYIIETTDDSRPIKFTRLKTFEIKPLSSRVLDKNISLRISKTPYGINAVVQQGIYPYIQLDGCNFNFSPDYIRLFKNGRLVPNTQYELVTTFAIPRIVFTHGIQKDDNIYIDITPYKYTEVYYQEEIPTGQCIIDLRNVINKPFDIRYYDVYLNGRKLGLNNVFTISPYKISLVNLRSIYNLQIFEKERDYEFLGEEYKTNEYYYSLDKLISEEFITDSEKKELIDKIINDNKDELLTINENKNDESRVDFSNEIDARTVYIFYSYEIVPLIFYNPDLLQVNKYDIRRSYSSLIYSTYYTSPTDSARNDTEIDRKKDYESVFSLDPDIIIAGDGSGQNTVVFPLGHLNDVDNDILNMINVVE